MFLEKTSSKEVIIFLFCLAIGIIFIVFAWNAYPVPAGDSSFFIVPAVQFAHNGVLKSPLYPSDLMIDKIIDPTGARRFLFYPPLFPLLVSALMPQATPVGAFVAIAIINITVIWLSALLFFRVATRRGDLNWPKVFVIILALIALASSLAENGRPEVLARLWVVLLALVPFYISKKYDWIFYGILLGLMFATHPAAGIISMVVLGIAFGVTTKFERIILKGSTILAITYFVSLSIIALGPFSVRETIYGTYKNAIVEVHQFEVEAQKLFKLSNLFDQYIASPVAPFYGVVLLALIVSGAYLLWKFRKRFASPPIVWLSVLALTYILEKITYSTGHVFYITLFAPVIFSILIYLFSEAKIFLRFGIALLFALVATGFLRTALLFPSFLRQEASLNDARSYFTESTSPYKDEDVKIGVTGGLWALTEDYGKVYSYNTWPDKPKENTALVFFEQRYTGMLTPPRVEGCNLAYDKFSRELPKVFGVKLGNTMPGYGYAVYKCL